MVGFKELGIRLHTIITAMMVAVGATTTMLSTAAAVTLQVSVDNLAPEDGIGLAHFWVGFHDGSFDSFNEGEPASQGIELMAEEQVIGLGARILEDFDIPEPQLTGLVINTFQAGTDYSFISPALQAALEAGADRTVISELLNAAIESSDFRELPPSEGTIAGIFADSQAGKNGGSQDILFFPTLEPIPLVQPPGTTASRTIEVGNPAQNRFFSYATMLTPTNDAFIGNDDPKSIEVFDEEGNFLGADFVVFGNQVWDAGTEVNNEEMFSNPESRGVDENGTIQLHPGLKAPGEGGVVDSEFNGASFANADFSASGYQVARITIKQVDEPKTIVGLFALGGLFLITKKMSRVKR